MLLASVESVSDGGSDLLDGGLELLDGGSSGGSFIINLFENVSSAELLCFLYSKKSS
jgi:hypothetical protein